MSENDSLKVWMVERTYGDDELNLLILKYVSEDGTRMYREERSMTSFYNELSVDACKTVSIDDTRSVSKDSVETYMEMAQRTMNNNEATDTI